MILPFGIVLCSHVLGALTPRKSMGSPRLAALLLPLLLLIGLSPSSGIGCPSLLHWSTHCLLASHMEDALTGGSAHIPCHTQLALPVSLKSWCAQLWLPACYLHLHLMSNPSDLQGGWIHFLVQKYKKSYKFRFCRRHKMPASAQKIVPGGHAVDLPYEFFLPCLCIEASYLQEDTVRCKKCPFQNWPEAYGSDFWKSVHFTDYSQHSQMVMALTLRCPLKLEASLCQRQGWHTLCEDLPNATARESQGWYVLEGVDLHPQLCFKFSFGNSSHVECPRGTAPSWNVSMDTQAQQLVLHFSSRMHATFSAAWSHPGLGQDSLVPPVYSISQTQGSSPVTLDLIIPFLKPGSCVLVWRSDVQFSWKHLLCPDVSHRHLGLLILALLALTTLSGIVLVLTRRRPLSGPSHARPVLLLHAAESEAQLRLVGALAELLRAALGGGCNVIVDLWEATRVARVGPLPWLWAARARVAQEQGTVLLLWSSADPSLAGGPDSGAAPLRALLRAAPRPLLLLAYFSRLCSKGDIPPPLRALPRYRLLRDLPRLLQALDALPSTEAASWGRLGARPCLQGRLELCRRLEREAAKFCQLRLSRDRRRGTGWNP
ncbi:interleukin-17 receptor E isoform X3 [Prionailurus bengalensis]|uniref:interleukin-17 receptor E isoform X3 n=1 Tax=Prionailurus bengalensis TaxID=37029 RepID=UPI001CA924FA|nr:interleukin-17 receptor E isoform X3 [Prionailurus bengalensis]